MINDLERNREKAEALAEELARRVHRVRVACCLLMYPTLTKVESLDRLDVVRIAPLLSPFFLSICVNKHCLHGSPMDFITDDERLLFHSHVDVHLGT